MELRDYWRTVQRRWKLIIGSLLIVVAVAAALTSLATPQYASSARLFVSTSGTDDSSTGAYQGGLFASQRVSSYADLVQSRELASAVALRVGDDLDPESLIGMVSANVVPETVNLELTVTDEDPAQAQVLAQAFAEQLQEMIKELETPSGQDKALIKATVVDDASFSDTPVSPVPLRNYGLAVILGLLLGLGLAVLRELLDNTVKAAENIAEVTDAPVLGNIAFDSATPKRPLVSDLDSHAPRVESFRVLRTNMQFVDVDSQSKVYVVSSSVPGEGKTTTAVNLALTLAQAGQRVALVEADLRRPRVGSILGIDNAVGLTNVLVGKVDLTDALETVGGGFTVLPSGSIPPNPSELLQSQAMADVLMSLRKSFDIVLLDAPPLLPVTDAALLGAQSDGALLVVRHGRTTKDQVANAIERLEAVGARTIGVVLNMAPTRRGRYGYGYGYGYGYAPDQGADSKAKRRGGRRSKPSAAPSTS